MGFDPFDITPVHLAITCIGGFIVIFGMFSLFLREKLYIGESCWAFLFGIIIGPYGVALFSPRSWVNEEMTLIDSEALNHITLEVTRIVLAIGVFAIGVELPKQYLKKHWRSLFFLLVPVMTWGWFVSAGLIYALIPGLSFLSSLAVAACLTPTDPILAAAVIGGKYADKHVPAHLRHMLAAESGCNDGAAFPFLFIAIYLTLDKSTAHAVQDWFLITVLYQVMLGVLFGSLLGYGFRHLMRFCERKDLIDRKSYVAQYVALAMLSVGSTTLLGSDDLLSAFASGTAFAWDGFFNKQIEDTAFSSVIDLLFNIAAFIYIGAWMPFHLFSSPVLTLTVWRLVVLALLVLILRRLPIVLALYRWIPNIKTFREAVFSGHFGPIGVGAIFISTLAVEQLPHPHDPPQNQVEFLAASIQPIVAFMVLTSIIIHGLSIPFFSLSRRVHSVSRTWSRHQSTDAGIGPEWATQTRRVVRAEDVVINRDRDTSANAMELGQSEKVDSDIMTASGSGDTPKTNAPVGDAEPRGEVTTKDQSPLDGTARAEEKTEWREGQHLVIERSRGPGNEVEVEVIPNAFDDKPEKLSTAFKGTERAVKGEVAKYMQKIKDIPGVTEQELAQELEGLAHGARHVRDEAAAGVGRAEDTVLPAHDNDDHQNDNDNETDDNWQDEEVQEQDADGEKAGSSSGVRQTPALEGGHSKRPKYKYSPRAIIGSSRIAAGKRRESIHRVINQRTKRHPSKAIPPPAAAPDETPCSVEEHRGRVVTSKAVSASGRPDTGQSTASRASRGRGAHAHRDSLRRLRFDSVHASSPERSIRFADQQSPSGTQTPALPGTPSLDVPSEEGHDTSDRIRPS
ncbi:Sodium/hydrogen exchanger family-domain-containing protein [Hysterangium stoloniferum]|nr:Sodium/hydrogen exchanger family-domain-containing protein [Hysterangium stoloniferum]